MINIWGRKTSVNVQKVMWAVGELDLPHERIDVGGKFGGLDTPEYGRLNPNRLVPTLEDGGVAVWESHAILRYLAAKYGEGTLWAADPAERSLADRWIEWTATAFQPAFTYGVFVGLVRTPPDQQDKAAIARDVAATGALLKILDGHLADQPYVAGAAFTMGDIATGAQLYRYFTLEIERPKLPNVEAWYERLQQRPAYREHVMVPYDELRVHAAG